MTSPPVSWLYTLSMSTVIFVALFWFSSKKSQQLVGTGGHGPEGNGRAVDVDSGLVGGLYGDHGMIGELVAGRGSDDIVGLDIHPLFLQKTGGRHRICGDWVVCPLMFRATDLRAVNANDPASAILVAAIQAITRMRRSVTNRCGVQRRAIAILFLLGERLRHPS